MEGPYIDPDGDHRCCGICPALRLPRTDFVVFDRPSKDCPFDTQDGHRYTSDRMPACVHPDKVGLEPDCIAPLYAPEQPEPLRPDRRWWRRR
jgi:hypothetical protein